MDTLPAPEVPPRPDSASERIKPHDRSEGEGDDQPIAGRPDSLKSGGRAPSRRRDIGRVLVLIRPDAPPGMHFFADVNHKKYYPVGCDAVNNLWDAKWAYYATEDAVITAGYTTAKGC